MQKREFSGLVVSPVVHHNVSALPSSATEVESGLRAIQGAYVIPHMDETLRFLIEHPFLIDVVQEAADALRRTFGSAATLSLELFHDPETENTELFALVHINEPVTVALEKLQTFDEAWFLDQQSLIAELFNVDVAFS